MTDDNVKRMPIEEFHRLGYLQEVNRKFFHPLGLALEVVIEDDGTQHLGGIWDFRDDPEGVNMLFFETDVPEAKEKAKRVADHWQAMEQTRMALKGYMVQPIR